MASELSKDIWKNWEKTGKQEFVKTCIGLLKDENASPLFDKKGKKTPFISHINNLIIKGVKGTIKKESVITTLQELVPVHSEVASIICDALNTVDAITAQTDSDDLKDRSNFFYVVKECEKFISEKLLKERLEIETLQDVGILKNKTFYSKFIKIKTKLYYKQRKFNLFREECEGYAKLITELGKDFPANANPNVLIDIVHSLIGCFNLDPNRVLDIILESFENKSKDARLFVPLISSYMKDANIIIEVLSTKLAFLKNCEEDIPQSFYILIAHLLQNNLIKLDDIYNKLTPDDKMIQKDCDKAMRDAKEYVRKLQIISTNKSEKDDTSEETETFQDKYAGNQKLGLCEALLLIGDWETARTLINRLPENFAVGYQPVALAICSMLHSIIEPVYSKHCLLGPKINRKPIPPHENPKSPKRAQNFEDLRDTAVAMLTTLGASLHYDPVLLCKVVRLSKAALSDMGIHMPTTALQTKQIYYDIVSVADTTILPSLSYLDCNCCVAEEIWGLVKLYPYQIRYCLYARWKNETYTQYPDLMRRRGDAEKQIKKIMKRVSKENVKPVGRLIGKLTHCSPGFLFDYVLLQIQVYNNLINPVVDSMKYLTNLSYDVLGFCLIETLANADKKRVKLDSTSISTWLQSLSSFCGAVYKKYTIELTGLLQYVANQLKAQKSLDLLILKEVVQKMAGVDPVEDMTIDQLNAMAGGDLLKGEAGYFSQVRNTKKSSQRLKEAMADDDLAVAMCLLMAQQNYCVIYKETKKSHLKLVGKLSDQCQDTLVQFGTFLGTTLTVDEYIQKLPTIQSMLIDYHIPTEVAFFLARPMFNHATNQKYDQLRKADPNYKKMSTSAKNQKYYEAVQEVMQPVQTSLLPLHPSKTWEDVTPQFLATFWSLTMYDLYVPEETYQQVISKAKQQSLAAMESSAGNKASKKEQERFTSMMEKLQDEKKKQSEHVEKVMYRLKQEKDNWFLQRAGKSAKTESITRFLQLCLFPRCTFTQIDAVYCAKFVHTIHMLKTLNFSTLLCYDRLFCDVTYSIISCTENEAMRYGRFLCSMLETVMRWHKSKEIFEKECSNFPGFMTKYRVSNHTADNLDNVGYENYRHVCHKWHYKLAKAVVTCLESKDYVQIRNSLIILIKIIPFFPVLIKLGQFLEKKIEKVREEEKNSRQDLFTLGTSYLGQLKQKMSGGNMMKEGEFHIPVEKEKAARISQGEVKEAKENSGKTLNGESREGVPKEIKPERREKLNRSVEEVKLVKPQPPVIETISLLDKSTSYKDKREERNHKDDFKEKPVKKEKEERRPEEYEREKEKERRRERKEEKLAAAKEEKDRKQEREERYIEMVSPKEDFASPPRSSQDRYYEERVPSERERHYYRERDEREGSSTTVRHGQETEIDRDVKRRKVDITASSKKHSEERRPVIEYYIEKEKPEKKERSSKVKDKKDKLTDEEKELKKERKLGRKRDRLEETIQDDLKRRRNEEKIAKLLANTADIIEQSSSHREKHHSTRRETREAREVRESREPISPVYARERSPHERESSRDKQRSSENKRR